MSDTQKPFIKRPKVVKGDIQQALEKAKAEASPEILQSYWTQVKTKLDKGDPEVMKMVERMYYGNKTPLVQVNQQFNQGAATRDKGYEAMIRLLEASDRDEQRQIETSDAQIITLEPEKEPVPANANPAENTLGS